MKRLLSVVSIVAIAMSALLLVACGDVKRPDGGSGLLPVGSSAPDVIGVDPSGNSLRLSGARGHMSVVYFYPKDGTPGCTKEACAFRDAFQKLATAHVTVFGVSRDSAESHKDFEAKHSLPFPLVADESGDVARAYGVPSTLGMTSRVSFLVDGEGKIAKVWPDVDPAVHADEVLAAANAK